MQARRQEGEPGTLVVNTIGDRAANQAAVFLTHLHYTGTSSEVIGVFSNSDKKEVVSRLEQSLTSKKTNFFTRIFRGNQDANQRKVVVSSYIDADLDGFDSTQAKAVAHFISYDRDTGRKIKPAIDKFKQALPDALHFGVIAVSPGNPLEQHFFNQEVEIAPAESLGLPIILLDQDMESSDGILKYKYGGHIPAERALMVGIGGLISNHKALPDLNRDPYIDLIASLTTQSLVVGVQIAQEDMYIDTFGNPYGGRHDVVRNYVGEAAGGVFNEGLRFTSLPRKESASLDVVTVQIPIKTNHRIWRDREFLEALAPNYDYETKALASKIPTAFSYGPQEPQLHPSVRDKTSIIAVRFYAAERVPSWHLIMKLAEKL